MARVTVRFPSVLRAKTGTSRIELEADTVSGALRSLDAHLPQLRPLLRDERGQIRPGVQFYVNDQHVRLRQGLETSLRDGDVLLIVPSVMGG